MTSTEIKTPVKLTPEQKKTQERKLEFGQLKARFVELREIIKTASDERKELEARLTPMAVELGLGFKGIKHTPPAG